MVALNDDLVEKWAIMIGFTAPETRKSWFHSLNVKFGIKAIITYICESDKVFAPWYRLLALVSLFDDLFEKMSDIGGAMAPEARKS